jgi:hypothetical protein
MMAMPKAGRGRWAALAAAGTVALTLLAGGAAPAQAACGNEALRQEQSSTRLPDCRAYEQVSAQDKGFSNADSAILNQVKVTFAEDGSALAYCNSGPGGALVPTAEYCGSYLSRRTVQGWSTMPPAPVACGQGIQRLWLSVRLEHAIVAQPESASCGVAPLDPSAPVPGQNLYRMSLGAGTPAFDLLTPRLGHSAGSRGFNTINGRLRGASEDAGVAVYESSGDQCSPVACGLAVNGTPRLFAWQAASGAVELVSRNVAGAALEDASALAGNPDPQEGARGEGYGAVSADGERIYFQNPVDPFNGDCLANGCELYLRENGATTIRASEQECSGGVAACPDDTAPDVFKWADRSGEKALFQTKAKLVDGDPTAGTTSDLYMYRDSANPATDKNLVLLSKDSEPGDGAGAAVSGVLGMSDDGDTVFFAAGGQLVASQPTAAGPKIYRWRWNGGTPTLEYLATLHIDQDGFIWSYSGASQRTMIERVSADGAHLLVDTLVQLDPLADQDASRDVYRWSAPSSWSCLSCQAPGTPSAGGSNVWGLTMPEVADKTSGHLQDGVTHNVEPIRVASADGNRVFFTSMDRLTADDVNDAQDVYEWNDGTLGLISGGTGGFASKLIGTTPTGNDVFFVSSDRLLGWDSDTLRDVYDARVGGGFPEPLPPTGGCEGEACRGTGSSAPTGAGAATAVFEGPGNGETRPRRPIRCPKGTKKVRVRGRTVCKKPQKQRKKSKRHSSRKGQ